MKLKIFTSDATKSSEKEFNLPVFEGSRGLQAVKEVVVAHRANARQGTRSTKTRGEVSGGGKKPWAQKGTGNARAGSNRSPIWRHGGITFGPTSERNWKKSLNKKMRTVVMRSAFSKLVADNKLQIIDSIDLKSEKMSQQAVALLAG